MAARSSVLRWLALCLGPLGLLATPSAAASQTIGTYSWRLAPFCNVYVFTVTDDGAGIRLTGYDDQCQQGSRVPVVGSVVRNPSGFYTFSFHLVAANGQAGHTIATLSPSSFSGPWIDSAGASGTLEFGVLPPGAGVPRPAPSAAIADGAITTVKLAPGAIDSVRIADGAITSADLAPDAVTSAQLALPLSKSISSGAAALSLTNAGSGPAAAFTLTNPSASGRAVEARTFGAGPAVFAESAQGNGVFSTTSTASSAGIFGRNLGGGNGIIGQSNGDNGNGLVGVNTANGNGVLGFSSGTGVGVVGQATTQFADNAIVGTGIAGRFRNEGEPTNTAKVLEITTKGVGNLIEASTLDSVGVPSVRFVVAASGDVRAHGMFINNGADVAEFIESHDVLEPGDVVEIDPIVAGRFRLSSHPSSACVAGVVTTRPAVLMNAASGRDDNAAGPALALAGRVPVKVSAENGAIAPGDLLVASSTPGHAMKAPAHPEAGTVIGKALGAHAVGSGVVEMLVMLR